MLRLVPLALLALAACGGREPRPGIPPQHALLITVEGLRADHCSAYLYPRATTNFQIDELMRRADRALTLDELAHAGVLFTQAFAPTGHPVDSFAALLSGCEANPDRSPGDAIDTEGHPNLAEAFAAAGFETAAMVTSEGELPEDLSRGFDRFDVTDEDRQTMRIAVDFMTAHDWGNGRGVFLWIHFRQPAEPFRPYTLANHLKQSINYAELYADPGFDGERDGGVLVERLRNGEELSESELRHLTDLYDGDLALADYLLFYLLDYFRYNGHTTGALDSTAIVIAGVNGVELGEAAGTQPWEALRDSSLRVPLVLRHPGSLTGRRIFAELTTLSDVAPTLADWFRLDMAVEGDGRSLLAITDAFSDLTFSQKPILASNGSGKATMRTSDWRVVVDLEGNTAPELYAIERMQEIEEDVSARYPGIARELEGTLRALLSASRQSEE